MILDSLNMFSDAQAITASAVSTNSVDLGAAGIDVGTGENLYVVLNVDVAFTDSGSDSTVAVTLITDSAAGLNDTPATLQTLGTFAALSAVGTKIIARIQPSASFERYLGLQYTLANGNLTTGSISAHLVHGVDSSTLYADNITIS